MELQKPGNFSRAWTRGCRATKSRKRASGVKSRYLTMQNEIRGVLGRMTAGAL